MPNEAEITEKFWKAVKSDRTMMVGLAGVGESLAQPLTAQLDDDHEEGPIYFFTAKDADLVQDMGARHAATAYLASKGHDLFASVEGELIADNDRATIDRLWNTLRRAWLGGRQERPQPATAALRAGPRTDLAERPQPSGRGEVAARARPEGGLRGQDGGRAALLIQRVDRAPFLYLRLRGHSGLRAGGG